MLNSIITILNKKTNIGKSKQKKVEHIVFMKIKLAKKGLTLF